ncbi:ArnT family glycosyltransferase [Roseimarinus sediminis]|uniref:ArnT family glycosyltransferase n=1 Tax=Roseimarinus sediminis TaxID=1610899 RepID=UPI003D1B8201
MNQQIKSRKFDFQQMGPLGLSLLFLFINLIQAAFTPLLNDEPYYWLWAQHPAWGYFDHPPLIAWLIKPGTWLMNNELGIRLFPVLLGSATLYIIYDLIRGEIKQAIDKRLFILLISSAVFMNLYTFVALPDNPLLFFSALFLWQFRRYLQNNRLSDSLLLGAVMALLLYSKYHGILIIAFALLPNLQLLKRKSFYLAALIALILFSPHIIWQLNNELPTVRFHLFEKGNVFRFRHVASYAGEQLLLTGPLLLLLLAVRFRPGTPFLKTVKSVTLGIFIFFLLASFRGMVNAYWTLAAWPGLLLLSYLAIIAIKQKKYIFKLLWLCTFIIIGLRINFLFNIVPLPHFNNRNPEQMALELNRQSEYPLVFVNMFVEPAACLLYQPGNCYAINNASYKKTHFNYLEGMELPVQHQTITLVSVEAIDESSRHIKINKGKSYYLTTRHNFISYQTRWNINTTLPPSLPPAVSHKVLARVLPAGDQSNWNSSPPNEIVLTFNMKNRDSNLLYTSYLELDELPSDSFYFNFATPAEEGNYKCWFSLSSDTSRIFNTYNSQIFNIDIQNQFLSP